jgi:AAT family amino acid transporter
MEQHSKQLGTWNLVMLALGTVVGGSFFLGTAVSLRNAGPGTLIAFAVGGLITYLILMALSEMTVAHPTHGSFRQYAETAFGPMASFVVGWLYWAGLVLALSSEGIAAATFARLWLPGVPVWLLALIVILAVTALNMLDVRAFGFVEGVLAAAKLLAIAGFILLMLLVIARLFPTQTPPVAAFRGEPFLPRGIGGLAGSMLTVLFTYAGFETLGLAAPEAKDPHRTVPRAVLLTALALVALYVGSILVVTYVLPTAAIREDVSPLIETLRVTGFPWLAGGLNLIVMTASVSTMLAAMYGLGRMLYSLAEEGQAPALLRRLTPGGIPRNAILLSAAGMLVGVVLAYLLPRRVYLFLISSGGFSLLFSYLMIMASQLVIRRREGCKPGACQVPWYPFGTWLGIILLVAAIASMPLVPGQAAGLIAGLVLLAVFSLAYLFVRRPAPEQIEPEPERTGGRVPLR